MSLLFLKPVLVTLLACCVLIILPEVQGELKGVALLFRHGERTPIYSFPNYGVPEAYKDLGLGQLTLVRGENLHSNWNTFSNNIKISNFRKEVANCMKMEWN